MDRLFFRIKQFQGGFHQLFLFGIDMSLIGQLVQCINDTAFTTPNVVLFITHLDGNAIGRFEADSPNVISQLIRVLFYLVNAVFTILSVDFAAYAVLTP